MHYFWLIETCIQELICAFSHHLKENEFLQWSDYFDSFIPVPKPVGCYWAGLSQVSNTLTISSSQTHSAHCRHWPAPNSWHSVSSSWSSWPSLSALFRKAEPGSGYCFTFAQARVTTAFSFGVFETRIWWRTECLSCPAVLNLFRLMGEANAVANGLLSAALGEICASKGKSWKTRMPEWMQALDHTGRDWSAEDRFALACEEELVKKEDMDE